MRPARAVCESTAGHLFHALVFVAVALVVPLAVVSALIGGAPVRGAILAGGLLVATFFGVLRFRSVHHLPPSGSPFTSNPGPFARSLPDRTDERPPITSH